MPFIMRSIVHVRDRVVKAEAINTGFQTQSWFLLKNNEQKNNKTLWGPFKEVNETSNENNVQQNRELTQLTDLT